MKTIRFDWLGFGFSFFPTDDPFDWSLRLFIPFLLIGIYKEHFIIEFDTAWEGNYIPSPWRKEA